MIFWSADGLFSNKEVWDVILFSIQHQAPQVQGIGYLMRSTHMSKDDKTATNFSEVMLVVESTMDKQDTLASVSFPRNLFLLQHMYTFSRFRACF